MRDSCPICQSNLYSEYWNMDFIVPGGWTLPTHNTVCSCYKCGMIWYNNNKTQDDYDTYYKEKYGFDGSLDCSHNLSRLNDLVFLTMDNVLDKQALIVDLGGGAGYIEKQLKSFGYTNVHTIDVGQELPEDIQFLICAEVLEHIYDVDKFIKNMCDHMHVLGKILVELPDARRMWKISKEAPLIDYQQKHINHFKPELVNLLFSKHYWFPEFSESPHVKGHIAYL
jgi:hypothetical protein